MFSGFVPNETLVPGLNWFNRNAIVNGKGGNPSQFLNLGDTLTAYSVLQDESSYNRFHYVPFVYDTLGQRGIRSIVVQQQAGEGQNRGTNNTLWRTSLGRAVLKWGADFLDPDLLVAEAESNFIDRLSEDMATDEIAARGGDFDLMVIYLAGLDHFLHDAGLLCEGGEPCADRYFRVSLHKTLNRLYKRLGDNVTGTVFSVLSDHGHTPVDEDAYIDLESSGSLVRDFHVETLGPKAAELTMGSILRDKGAASEWTVGKEYEASATDVIFVPQFAMAQIYVAANAGVGARPDWKTPPSLERLAKPAWRIYDHYVKPSISPETGEVDWAKRPIAAILVRIPGQAQPFTDGKYKVFAPERAACKTAECPFETQLFDLGTLDTIGPDAGTSGEWAYVAPERRVNDEFGSVNTGDIVLLANIRGGPGNRLREGGRGGFSFGQHNDKPGKGYRSQHGSLVGVDAHVPVAFGNPSAIGDPAADDLLGPIRALFSSHPMGGTVPLEAPALKSFFIVP